MQQKIFCNEKKSKAQSLTIVKAGKQKLTKNQEAFNKLTQKIERLQKEIEKKQLQMDLAMKLYGTDVQTCRIMLTEQRRELIIVLWDNYTTKKLSKVDQRYLKQIIREHVQFLLLELGAEPDAEIKQIFEALEGDNYDDLLEQERGIAREEMVEELKKFNVNLKDVDTSNEKELAKLLHETRRTLFEEHTANKNERAQTNKVKKKTAKQLEAEKLQQEIDEIKQRNIGTIYKQLAKLFHPDLEQDEERKLEKEILMKELTVAYEAKNLHALLTLELKWIHNENEHLENLTEEKLAVYLQILKEQAAELEYEKSELYHHPQYAVLLQEFGWDIKRAPVQIVQKHLLETAEMVNNFMLYIIDFKSDLALRNIKQMIKQWKEMQEDDLHFDEEDLYRMLYGK